MDHKNATTIGTACPAPICMLHSPDCGCSFVLGVVALIPLSIFPLLTYLRMRRNLSSAGRSRMMWFEESATEYYATMFHFKFQHWQSVLLVERWITGAVQPLQLRARVSHIATALLSYLWVESSSMFLQGCSLFLFTLTCLVVHILAQPFKLPKYQHFHTFCNVLLVIMSVFVLQSRTLIGSSIFLRCPSQRVPSTAACMHNCNNLWLQCLRIEHVHVQYPNFHDRVRSSACCHFCKRPPPCCLACISSVTETSGFLRSARRNDRHHCSQHKRIKRITVQPRLRLQCIRFTRGGGGGRHGCKGQQRAGMRCKGQQRAGLRAARCVKHCRCLL